MNYTTTSASKPTAHITKNKSRLKVYNGKTVFLNDKDNFEFEIHNPTQKSVLCKIKLNGKYVFTSGLIIRPDVSIEFYYESQIVNYPHLSGGNWNTGWTHINTGSPYYGNITFTNNSSTTYLSTTSHLTIGTNTFEGPNIRSVKSKNSIETGRIEKGEKSNQKFTNSYEEFNYFASHQISLKILPLSNKINTTEDIKHYCTECGIKTKSKYKFCPSCGNKL